MEGGNDKDKNQLKVYTSRKAYKIPEVVFNGWYVDGQNVLTAKIKDKVTAKISLSGGLGEMYTLRIRRDVRYSGDETITEINFKYNGIQMIQEISFVPREATGDSNTNGYHVDLLLDVEVEWRMIDSYPPRLRVAIK